MRRKVYRNRRLFTHISIVIILIIIVVVIIIIIEFIE